MQQAKQQSCGNRLSRLTLARRAEQQAVQLAKDVKTLTQWLSHDVLALAGPPLPHRQELFDFIVAELRCRESTDVIRSLCVALQNNGMTYSPLPRYSMKLVEIAQRFDTPLFLIRAVCLLHRKPTSTAYWTRWNQLHHQLSGKFHLVLEAVKGGNATNTPCEFIGGNQLSSTQLLLSASAAGTTVPGFVRFSSTIAHLCAVNAKEWARVQLN